MIRHYNFIGHGRFVMTTLQVMDNLKEVLNSVHDTSIKFSKSLHLCKSFQCILNDSYWSFSINIAFVTSRSKRNQNLH